MINNLNHNELIDAYLAGRLTESEQLAFETTVQQDPILQQEFQMQKDIVHSLQNMRRAELKNRLNSIDVTTTTTFGGGASGVAIKALIGSAVVAVMGTGVYFAFNQKEVMSDNSINQIDLPDEMASLDQFSLPAKPLAIIEKESSTLESPLAPAETTQSAISNTVATQETVPAKATKNKTTFSKPKTVLTEKQEKGIASNTKPASGATVVKPNVISKFEDADVSINKPEANAPADKLANVQSFSKQNIDIATEADSKFNFHYKFYNNKLSLYGEFENQPYEVLELNTTDGSQFFLYHKENYYQLNPYQRKATKLKKLNNNKLIKDLDIIRNKKYNK